MSINNVVCSVYFLFIALFLKHFIVDFTLQGPYQYLNKGKFLHPGGVLHSFLHVLFSSIIMWLFVSYMRKIGLEDNMYYTLLYYMSTILMIEFLVHYCIDYVKVNFNKRYKLDSSNKYFWWTLGLDQLVHSLNYVLSVYLMLKYYM